jgi:O-antigen ligase
MATMSVGAALLILAVVFESGGGRRLLRESLEFYQIPIFRRYLWLSAFLALACVLSLVSAQFFPLTFEGKVVPVSWSKDLGKLWYFLFPWILAVGWKRLSETQRDHVLRTWIFTFGILSIMGMFQVFTGWPRAQINPNFPGHFHSSLFHGQHLSTASILIFPFFASLDLLYLRPQLELRPRLISRPVLAVFTGFGLLTLMFTFSRTLWIGLPIGLGLWILRQLPKRLALASLASIGITGFFLTRLPVFSERLHHIMGIDSRLTLWKMNWMFFQNRPWFGVGLGKNFHLSATYFESLHLPVTTFFVGHAHNTYIEILAGLGIFGTVAWVFWMGLIFRILWRIIRDKSGGDHFAYGLFCAWIVFLINGLTQVNFWEGKVLHQVMWVTGLLLFWNSEKSRTLEFSKVLV